MAEFDTLFRAALLPDGSQQNICVSDGRIAAIVNEAEDVQASEIIDVGGALVLPGFIDGHVHLDTTLFGDVWRPHRPCTAGFDVGERLAIQKDMMAIAAPVETRAAALIERAVSRGTTRLRTHVEIDVHFGLRHLEATLAVRERYCDAVDIQIVALARGLLKTPGTHELLEEAMKNGAEIVGGLDPAGFEGDVGKHLDIVFAMAERHGTGVDLHLHDGGTLGLFEMEEIARRTKAQGLQGRVNVSHAYALGEMPWARVASTAEQLAETGVSIMTNAPGDHAFPPVLALREAGVTIFAGNDDIRDSWWPYGDADMLERAMLIGYRSGFLTDEELAVAFDMVSDSAARALGLTDYGLQPGMKADFVVLDAAHIPEAVVARPRRNAVYKAGRRVASEGVYGS